MARRRKKLFERLISFIERVGNHLPHPFSLFLILIGMIFILSLILSRTGVSASYLSFDPETQQRLLKTASVNNLFQREMLQSIMENFVKTFIYFIPVGFVIIMVLGVSLAEQTGFFSAVIRLLIFKTPPFLITFVIAVTGICANIASDAGIIIAPTLGGAIFLALGRHPIAGVCAGYVAAYGGFSANLFISGTDVILAGITQSAVRLFDLQAPVHPLMNWYAMIGSTFILAFAITLITEKIIVPYLGEYDPPPEAALASGRKGFRITPDEKKGLLAAGAGSLLFLAALLLMTVPAKGLLRNAEGKLLPSSPLISGIIFIIFSYFFLIGIIYGVAAKTIRSERQIPKMMEKALVGVAGFLVVCLPASIFIDLFHKSNLTTIIAVKGAHLIKNLQIGHMPTLLTFALLCAVLNLFITSGLTKWLILAPIFVPLFYQLGLSPAITQMSYRIGDSTTNIISPISAYLPFLLGLLEKYKNRNQEIGIGSAISLMLPYSVLLLLVWLLFLGLWLLLGLNPGPGVSLFVH
jgi:aminobenzoyl-glutamate transport protein